MLTLTYFITGLPLAIPTVTSMCSPASVLFTTQFWAVLMSAMG